MESKADFVVLDLPLALALLCFIQEQAKKVLFSEKHLLSPLTAYGYSSINLTSCQFNFEKGGKHEQD